MIDIETTVMTLLLHAGEARSCAMHALQYAREQNWGEAQQALNAADNAAREAHKIQTQLIGEDEGAGKLPVTLILVHAQDHLMNAMLCRDLAGEIIALRQQIWQASPAA